MEKILHWYPASFFSDRSMLLVGQYLISARRPAEARRLFEALLQRFPDSPLTPEIELAVARKFGLENKLASSVSQFAYLLWALHDNGKSPPALNHLPRAKAQRGATT